MAITRGQISKQVEGKLRGARDEKKKKQKVIALLKKNPILKKLRSRIFSLRVVQSKKLYNRKRIKNNDKIMF